MAFENRFGAGVVVEAEEVGVIGRGKDSFNEGGLEPLSGGSSDIDCVHPG